jgi:Tol biopolymer transport system component
MEPGTRLGPYEIVEQIGQGGMGVVFRARDARLGRDVAVKTLSGSLAGDPERRARFEREARLLAALNHPHIGAIYGVEEADGGPALVLELVEGETLHDRLHASGRPRLTIEEAVAIARQIAEGLEAAHEKGIVHRDLKPSNVKITPAGGVKVLDFGLGRVASQTISGGGSEDPTITSGRTAAGTVLGTSAYMSPEQARGAVVDRRADVWAFGCVLFEMLAGERAFGGETISDTLAHVIAHDPDWSRLPEATPASIRRLLRRSLQKDPRRRLRDIGDARLELDEPPDEGPPRFSATATLPAREVRLLRLTDTVGIAGAPALSPDGKMVAFVIAIGGRRQIFVRLLAGGVPLQLTRDDVDHDAPRWTADSSALVYHVPHPETGGHLWQISALGGQARRIGPAIGGADVSHDGRRLAFFRRSTEGTALVVAAIDGSSPRTVLTLPAQFGGDQPRWSPDDRRIAFKRAAVMFDNRLLVVGAENGELRTDVRADRLGGHAWLSDGSGLVYSSSTGSTMPYPPTNGLRLVGSDGDGDRQLTFGDVAYLAPDVGTSGRLVASRSHCRSDVWSFPIDDSPRETVANATRITHQAGQVQVPSVSPDGTELVYISDNGGHSNLWVAAVDGTRAQQITFESDPAVIVAAPSWEPEGERILFVRPRRGGSPDLCLVGRDGGAVETLVCGAIAPCWSGDGRAVYFSRGGGEIESVDVATGKTSTIRTDRAISPAVPLRGGTLYFSRLPEVAFGPGGQTAVCRASPEDGDAEVLVRVANARVPLFPLVHLHSVVSPDGRWLAAPLVDGATANVWLIPTDGGPMRPVTDFGERPVLIARNLSWSPDSRRVYAAVADAGADIVLLDGLLA